MGKQSARIYFQGKDHKEIYYQGHYHKAMYIGSQLVWEKITGTKKELDVVSSISYNGVFYVVRQFSDLGAKMRILVGPNLNSLLPFDTIENLKQRSNNIVMLIKDVFAIIYPDRASMPVTWHTYLLSERGLDINTYKENDMPVPTELHQSIGCIISHEQVFFSNYKGNNSDFKSLPGFNNNSGYSSDSGDVFIDTLLINGLVWGISCKLHSDSKMTYLQQYCYSTDENLNMGKKIISFPSDIVEDIKRHLTEQLHNKYDYENCKIENIEFGTVEYGNSSPKLEYVINDRCYRYVYINPQLKYSYEGLNTIQYDLKCKVLLVYRILLSEFKIEDAYIIDLGYNANLDNYSMLETDNRWNIPYEVISQHDFENFVLYRVKNYKTQKIDFMYNIKADGGTVHTIKAPLNVSGTYNCNNGAYLIDNYIYINNSYTVTSGEFSKQLRIDIINNVIEEIERPTVYYTEEE